MEQEVIWLTILLLRGKIPFYPPPPVCIFNLIFFIYSFFPVIVQPPISVLSNSVYGIFVKAGICRKTVRRVDIASAPTGITVALPGIRSLDMDRRK